MTPEAHETRARRRRWRVGTPLVFLASGALFMISAANSEGTDLRPGRTTDLAGLVRNESKHLEKLQETLSALCHGIPVVNGSVSWSAEMPCPGQRRSVKRTRRSSC